MPRTPTGTGSTLVERAHPGPLRRVARSGGDVEASSETLDADARRFEGLQLVLRTREGVPADAFAPETLDLLDGLVAPHPEQPGRLSLTRAGRLMANEVSLRLR